MSSRDEALAIANVFLREALEDEGGGSLRSLEEYQRRFPSFEATIADEYRVLIAGRRSASVIHERASHIPVRTLAPGNPPIAASTLAEYLAATSADEFIAAEEFARILDLEEELFERPASRRIIPSSGEPFGPYRIVGEIGRGGQGVVLLAEDTRLPRVVALKLLHSRDAETAEGFARFRREAELVSKLDHPGICTVHETGIIDGVPFISMRRIEGRSLSHRWLAARTEKSGEVPDRKDVIEVLGLIENVARALHVAHEAGIVHRDIKPGNIMVTPDGQPVLLDFGLAREEEAGATVTLSGDVLGTPAYVSPEQLGSLGPIRVDRRTDVWSLGVVLFEGASGQRPFESTTRDGLYKAILSEPPPSARKLNPSVSRDLQVIVETAIEKNRDRRYQSALALAEDLRRVRMHEPIHATPPTSVARVCRWIQRRPAAATAIIALLVGTAMSTWFAWKASTRLAEWGRLADARKLEALIFEANESLWPTIPEKIPATLAWLTKARELADRLPDHEAALSSLQDRALPYDERTAHSDRAAYAVEYARIEAISILLKKLSLPLTDDELEQRESQRVALSIRARKRGLKPPEARELEALMSETRDGISAAQREQLIQERFELSERVKVRRTWNFHDAEDTFKHERLRELVEALRQFRIEASQSDVSIRAVESRLKQMRDLERRLREDDCGAWQRCVADISESDKAPYFGLKIEPIPGFVPLGKDEASGLWEFWHVQSGVRPKWEGDELGVGHVLLDPESGEEGVVFVLVPPGTFRMGARLPEPKNPLGSPNTERKAQLDEAPVREVKLAAYYLSKYEVTQGQWTRLTGKNPSFQKAGHLSPVGVPISARHPVTGVNWYECDEFSRRMGASLPTEAQWEFACRARSETTYGTGGEVASLKDHANIADEDWAKAYNTEIAFEIGFFDGFVEAAPVGSLRPNALGLHDLHGNVSEWCRDGYDRYRGWDTSANDGLRCPPHSSRGRVTRGGSYKTSAISARSAARGWSDPTVSNPDRGLRPARSVAP